MIKSLKLKNFRNFEDIDFYFEENKNFFVGENWKWKTNILEAISLISWNNITKISFENLVKKGQDLFYIEALLDNGDKVSISYDKKEKKKRYALNNKNTTKSKLLKTWFISVIFSPMIMNMFYLSPFLRRDFLDSTLCLAFEKYNSYLKTFKTILINRNKLLKNIKERNSDISEIKFWDKKYVEICKIIYNYRFWIIDFLKENIDSSKGYFFWKINKIEIRYKTKVNKDTIEEDIKNYLEKNIDRDIILTTTQIWPHIDDFEIFVDDVSLIEFASRWETKSIIIELKLLEIQFIEKYSSKKPILLIDDLLSELDENHKNLLLEKIQGYQTFITSIRLENIWEYKLINL